ncbi:MAG: hypothetical protein ACLRQT_06020 [Alistipes sp.]
MENVIQTIRRSAPRRTMIVVCGLRRRPRPHQAARMAQIA